jgi:hypothetical protein
VKLSSCGASSTVFRPLGRGTFSCLPKRKYPKRKAPDGLSGHKSAIYVRISCASRKNRRSRNSRSRCARLRSNRTRALAGFSCAGNPRSGQASGTAFLLDTFLWRSKEKYLARMGETRSQNIPCPSGRNKLIKSTAAPGTWPLPLQSTRHHPWQPVQRQHHCYAPQDQPQRRAGAPAAP